MKVFQCGHCGHPLFFENNRCENCGHICGYRNSDRMMLTFDPQGFKMISDRENTEYKYCKNKEYDVCNWLLDYNDPNELCHACQLNGKIPDLSDSSNVDKWRELENAKHRLIYQLQKIGLDLPSKAYDDNGLSFDFVSKNDDPNIMTGHANGVITILLTEADPAQREQMRVDMSEPYRALIGHLRHEVGHYFWDRLVWSNQSVLEKFRACFGDERASYSEALQEYYRGGAPINWQHTAISKYATAHPWEDWAETWAHYLHIMDIVETAYFFGLKVDPTGVLQNMKSDVLFDPYLMADFDLIVKVSIPLTFTVNSINRAMGVSDVYPFVLNQTVIDKMKFIHQLVRNDFIQ